MNIKKNISKANDSIKKISLRTLWCQFTLFSVKEIDIDLPIDAQFNYSFKVRIVDNEFVLRIPLERCARISFFFFTN